ncbi:MAG: hypothetical protein IPK81_24845 [Rhodospirillales bacterium]|nr:MAG: hypothetical protein IPK81_24845 [Rhodospirillales bacterium]
MNDRPDASIQRASARPGRPRWPWIAAGVGALAVVSGLSVISYRWTRENVVLPFLQSEIRTNFADEYAVKILARLRRAGEDIGCDHMIAVDRVHTNDADVGDGRVGVVRARERIRCVFPVHARTVGNECSARSVANHACATMAAPLDALSVEGYLGALLAGFNRPCDWDISEAYAAYLREFTNVRPASPPQHSYAKTASCLRVESNGEIELILRFHTAHGPSQYFVRARITRERTRIKLHLPPESELRAYAPGASK